MTAERPVKHDADKPRLGLLPPDVLLLIARVFTFGAKKYAPHNWCKGFEWSRLYDAAQRHLVAWQAGENNDPESSLPHLGHALSCLMMLAASELRKIGKDDRHKLPTIGPIVTVNIHTIKPGSLANEWIAGLQWESMLDGCPPDPKPEKVVPGVKRCKFKTRLGYCEALILDGDTDCGDHEPDTAPGGEAEPAPAKAGDTLPAGPPEPEKRPESKRVIGVDVGADGCGTAVQVRLDGDGSMHIENAWHRISRPGAPVGFVIDDVASPTTPEQRRRLVAWWSRSIDVRCGRRVRQYPATWVKCEPVISGQPHPYS